MTTATDALETALEEFVDGIVGAVPSLLTGLVFLALAYAFIRVVRFFLRRALRQVYPADQRLIADFGVIVVTVLLWFGAGLAFLKVVGMGEVAASLGTAIGFIALGVSYALSEMIEDTVAGVYLLKDPDFNPGNTVDTAGLTGVVSEIGLRKTRFRLADGDTAVRANRDVESKWTKRSTESE